MKNDHKLRVICATSVASGQEAFADLGDVVMVPEADISRATLEGADVLVARSKVKVTDALLEGSSLSFYGTATAGYDHVNVAALERRGIVWSQAPGSNANSVAEYVCCVLSHLALTRSLIWAGKTLAVVGAGNVGSRLAELAGVLGMKVLLNDPPLQAQTGDARYLPLADILKQADVVSLHVPLIDGGPHPTRGMVDAAFLKAMKKGAVFINASRGEVVDETVLKRASDDGFFEAIVLDVFDHEPDIDLSMLQRAQVGTPHIAGYSLDGRLKGTQMVYQAACRHLGRDPVWSIPADTSPKLLSVDQTLKEERFLYAAMLAAYDPLRDDQRLRELPVGLPMRTYFQQLRQHYPERREFPHYAVNVRGRSASLIARVTALGFHRDSSSTGLNSALVSSS